MLEKQLFSNDDKYKFLIIALLCALFYFPILYAGVFFRDDIYRISVESGGFIWHHYGRFLATLIAYIYSGTTSIVIDAFPLTWFINIFLLSFSMLLVYKKFKPQTGNLAIWISALLLINPFFTANLLYRFDSIGMNLAINFAIIAFYIPDTKKHFLVKVFLLVISLNFYQSGINFFLSIYALFLFLSLAKTDNARNFFKIFFYVIFIYAIASILYYIEIKIFTTTNRAELLPLDGYLFIDIIRNNIKALTPFLVFWSYYKWYIIPILPFSIFGLFFFFNKRTLFFSFLCLSLLFISILGGLAFIKDDYIYSNRVLNYFPFIIIFLFMGLNKLGNKFKYLVFIPIFACFIFNYRVGNILRIQNLFEQPLFYAVSVDIYSHPEIKNFYVIGSSPISNFAKNLAKQTPFNGYLSRLAWRSAFRINEYTSKKIVKEQWGSVYRKAIKQFEMLKKDNELELIKNSYPFYCLYKNKDTGFIDWQCESYQKN